MYRVSKYIGHLSHSQQISDAQQVSNSEQDSRVILLGPKPKEFGIDIGELTNLNEINSNNAMRDQFWKFGYGLFRGAIDRNLVLKARDTILKNVESKYNILSDVDNGILKSYIKQKDLPFTEGKNEFTHNQNVLNVLENDGIKNIMKILLKCDNVKTFDYKWLRLVSPGSNTGIHVDNVYMSRGTKNLLTCWIPLMDIKMELGTVFVLDGSYYLPSFNIFQQTYASMDAEAINLNGTGHFTQNPDDMKQFFKNKKDYKIRWKSCDFKAGDILIFTMRTVHMSSVNINQNNKVRISCDTRWLNANEKADDRFMYNQETKSMGHTSDLKFGLHNNDDDTTNRDNQVTINQLRTKWGI